MIPKGKQHVSPNPTCGRHREPFPQVVHVSRATESRGPLLYSNQIRYRAGVRPYDGGRCRHSLSYRIVLHPHPHNGIEGLRLTHILDRPFNKVESGNFNNNITEDVL